MVLNNLATLSLPPLWDILCKDDTLSVLFFSNEINCCGDKLLLEERASAAPAAAIGAAKEVPDPRAT